MSAGRTIFITSTDEKRARGRKKRPPRFRKGLGQFAGRAGLQIKCFEDTGGWSGKDLDARRVSADCCGELSDESFPSKEGVNHRDREARLNSFSRASLSLW